MEKYCIKLSTRVTLRHKGQPSTQTRVAQALAVAFGYKFFIPMEV